MLYVMLGVAVQAARVKLIFPLYFFCHCLAKLTAAAAATAAGKTTAPEHMSQV